MGVLQELSLLTGIISKTALPGKAMNVTFYLAIYFYLLCENHIFTVHSFGSVAHVLLLSQVSLRWVGRSTMLLSWSSRVT